MLKGFWQRIKGDFFITIPVGFALLLIVLGWLDAKFSNYYFVWGFSGENTPEMAMQQKITFKKWVVGIISNVVSYVVTYLLSKGVLNYFLTNHKARYLLGFMWREFKDAVIRFDKWVWTNPRLAFSRTISLMMGFSIIDANFFNLFVKNIEQLPDIFFILMTMLFLPMIFYIREKNIGEIIRAEYIPRFLFFIVFFFFYGFQDFLGGEVFIKKGDGITIIDWTGFLIAVTGIYLLAVRSRNQDRQIEVQIDQNTDQMFNAAVALLGSGETSARTGAIYSLYNLALKSEKYRGQIAQILCSHIRSKTRERAYQEEHKDAPSNEIQAAIDLLFKKEGLYHKFKSELPEANLSYAYLTTADFTEAHCERANFTKACCERASFKWAHCEEANFMEARCEGAYFTEAHCEGAYFRWTHCEGAEFVGTHCEGATFRLAHCEGSYFTGAHCEGAKFAWTHCERAEFVGTHCEGAKFLSTHCEGACFARAHCEGAEFKNARCEGANFTAAHCQGDIFVGAYGQGAYADSLTKHQELADRIGKDTDLKNIIISGEVDEKSVQNVERAQKAAGKFLPEGWYSNMQKVIKENKGKDLVFGDPEGIETGILKDSEDLQRIIKKLEEVDKWRRGLLESLSS